MARATTLVGDWKKLADAAGGVGSLATRLDRNRSTIERWANGEMDPRIEVKTAVGVLAAELGVDMPPFGDEARRALKKAG